MKSDNIAIAGNRGTWYVIDQDVYAGEKVYLLEHEDYGDEAPCIIINDLLEVVLDEVYNGFEDLDDL